ncbi:DUF6498-containing protein [Oligosphaera ethanolica]|uniref:Uncharacterized protein n=1 Tax=Oligosphaera ethanolica TaxID=760260 RepID=A0AAE4ANM8_9BACT|nr:DUF6498-containing protein [Oligosphaera ethanolica]MDQ0290439.1 hypothetical protein [Oligosphaera ethanolica]
MTTPASTSRFIRVLPDIAAFALGLGLAYGLNWQTADLVWSLWLGSLVLGYLTLLSGIAGPALMGFYAISRPGVTRKQRVAAVLAGGAAALFFLGFFSLHFGGFHAGHSVFLNLFFPIPGLPKDGFGDAFMNPPLLFLLAWRHLIRPYGLFLIPAAIAERQHVFMPLIAAIKALRKTAASDNAADADKTTPPHTPKNKGHFQLQGAMARPYINVVRMHILIFFFAFAHALKLDSFLVYATVYTVYFFPWQELKTTLAEKKAAKATPPTTLAT